MNTQGLERGRRTKWMKAAIAMSVVTTVGCFGFTKEEATESLEEASISAEASALVSGNAEIYTNFTIGAAAADAAQELRTFVESQVPCAKVTLVGPTLTIEYGANPGSCTYRGQTYHGTQTVTVMSNQMNDVVVHHEWHDFHNDRVQADGAAVVTWSFEDRTRHVSHELTWKRLSDGRTGVGTGERTQSELDGGLAVGFRESGEVAWTGESGMWDLTIDDVEMRWVDPCPQAGRYVLVTPFAKTLTLSFVRKNAGTITATIANGTQHYDVDVATAH